MANLDPKKFDEALQRQIELLNEIKSTVVADADENRTLRESIRKKALRISLKLSVLLSSAIAAGIGSVEGIGYLADLYRSRELASGYAEVAREIYHRENSPAIAMRLMDKALELDDDPQYQTDRVYFESMEVVRKLLNLDRPYTQEELDSAQESLAQAILLKRNLPDQANPRILLAQIYIVLKQTERALPELQEAVRLEPDNEFAHMRLATLLDGQGQSEEALVALDRALDVNPKYKWALLWKGVILGERLDKWGEARGFYKKAIEEDPNFDLAYYNLAWSFIKAEPSDYESARGHFEKALKIRPSFKEALYGLGMLYGYQNDYELSENYLSKAIALDEEYLTAWKWRGIVRSELKDMDGALTDFSEAISLNPMDASLYLRRGRVSEELGKFNEAAEDYHFSANQNPNDPEIWLSFASLFAKTGDYSKAIENVNKAKTLGGETEELLSTQAFIAERSGDFSGAVSFLTEAISVSTYKPERFLLRRAELYRSRGDHKRAKLDYAAVRDKDPSNHQAWLGEAKSAITLNQRETAREALSRYIELRPQDNEARRILNQLIKRG
jgi:tetratricopeptide (TPR) repeat protein